MDVGALKSQFSELCTFEKKKKVLVEVGGSNRRSLNLPQCQAIALFSYKILFKGGFSNH
jgi:hypothetical protein